ncbi:MAG: sigma factor-like helix-turn-helix DNA-binding protein [bacterium]|nr:sigma factor-like helix-turn-helix DNA-binding protein [bacterium]MDZ4299836.1 sigma factor-like helix-turn-helix DNA-binding protein [Candidatus Sungbacteria bacterium]
MVLNLPIAPHEATKMVLKKLSSKRMRDVLEKRYGLKGRSHLTLEAIGQEYKITRERVRQIENDALRHIAKPEHLQEVEPLYSVIEAEIGNSGGVMAEHHLFSILADERYHPHLGLLLGVGERFRPVVEDDHHHSRWTLEKTAAKEVERIMDRTVEELARNGKTVSAEELRALVARSAKEVTSREPGPHTIEAYLATSKLIRKNPYDEYGLVGWPTISPSGVKDKAYAVLARAGHPVHFREVARAIDEAHWSKRKAHPQTVHNELIKDKRFVLVGRGLYALGEWGYEPGVVRDVIASVLKNAKHTMTREEIIEATMQKRMVKVPTILLNLQNRSLFHRTDDGKYRLA